MPHHYLAAQTSESCTVSGGNIRRDVLLRTCYTKIGSIIIFLFPFSMYSFGCARVTSCCSFKIMIKREMYEGNKF